MSKETLTEKKKKLKMKERRAPKEKKNFYSELILRSDEIRAQ